MAISILYDWPVSTPGSTTPAPSTQAPPTTPTSTVKFNDVVATLVGDGTSTSVTITHNLELSSAELGQVFPEVAFEPIVTGAPTYWVSARAANTVTIGLSGTTSATFAVVRIRRPFSASK